MVDGQVTCRRWAAAVSSKRAKLPMLPQCDFFWAESHQLVCCSKDRGNIDRRNEAHRGVHLRRGPCGAAGSAGWGRPAGSARTRAGRPGRAAGPPARPAAASLSASLRLRRTGTGGLGSRFHTHYKQTISYESILLKNNENILEIPKSQKIILNITSKAIVHDKNT